jgi:hypothetical protein
MSELNRADTPTIGNHDAAEPEKVKSAEKPVF